MHRVFLDVTVDGTSPLKVEGGAYHHLVRVLRHRDGDWFAGLTGDGHEYRCRIIKVDTTQKYLEIEIQGEFDRDRCPAEAIHLYPALLKSTSFTMLLRKTTEMGVSRITPVVTTRSVPRFQGEKELKKKLDRWIAIVRDATEQCGRRLVPDVCSPLPLPSALATVPGDHAVYYLDRAGVPLVSRLLEQASGGVSMFVGSEGGFTEEEQNLFDAGGVRSVSLGPHIFRADTASIAACAVVTAVRQMWCQEAITRIIHKSS